MRQPDSVTRRRSYRTCGHEFGGIPNDRAQHRFRHQDKAPPSERITVGFIGCGKMANDYHLPELARVRRCSGGGRLRGRPETRREHAQRRVEKAYEGKRSTRAAPPMPTSGSSSPARTSTPCASPRRNTGTRSRPSRP